MLGRVMAPCGVEMPESTGQSDEISCALVRRQSNSESRRLSGSQSQKCIGATRYHVPGRVGPLPYGVAHNRTHR